MKKFTIMKKLIFTLIAFVTFAGVSMAQMPDAITIEPVNATAWDTVTLKLNTNHTCPAGAFDTVTNVHMHGGVSIAGVGAWQNVVEFDGEGANGQATALTQENDTIWSIEFVPAEYFGVDYANYVTGINTVFNNGSWDAEGKDYNENEECTDFSVPLMVNPVKLMPADGTSDDEVTLKLNTAFTCPAGAFDTVSNVYIHSGVTLEGAAWQNVVAFDSEEQNTALTQVEDSIWEITYIPADFYGLDEGVQAEAINMVFNRGDWDAEGKFMNADSTCSDISVMLATSGVGFGETELNEFKMYPNPTSNVLNIEGLDNITKVEVFNTVGQRVRVIDNVNTANVQISTGDLHTGIYFVNFYNERSIITTQKFMKR